MAPVLQSHHSMLGAGMYLELAQGEPAGVQRGDALGQVSLLLRLFVHDLLIPLLLGFCQHQALQAQADGGSVDGQIPLLRSLKVPVGPRDADLSTSVCLCSAVAETFPSHSKGSSQGGAAQPRCTNTGAAGLWLQSRRAQSFSHLHTGGREGRFALSATAHISELSQKRGGPFPTTIPPTTQLLFHQTQGVSSPQDSPSTGACVRL